MGDKREEAAGFFLESLPSVAEDYYLLLGYAHRARMNYSRAREAFEQYNNTLSAWKQKQFRPLLNQLLSDCEFGGANVRDSVPAFVINPGPAVNSYYDEYAAVEDSKNERIFFVTRRPDYLPDVPVGRDVFEEESWKHLMSMGLYLRVLRITVSIQDLIQVSQEFRLMERRCMFIEERREADK